tara:strand:+ start:2385 stop:2705 length:321 start_codon:yes stop_codon:yes gene_type:complete
MNHNHEIATTILNQIGGIGRIKAMTGANNFVALENGVSFRLPKMSGVKANFVKITLSPQDLYDVETGNIRKKKGIPTYKKNNTVCGVFVSNLIETLEVETGMYYTL